MEQFISFEISFHLNSFISSNHWDEDAVLEMSCRSKLSEIQSIAQMFLLCDMYEDWILISEV